MSSVLVCHSLPYSFETGSLTQMAAMLVARKLPKAGVPGNTYSHPQPCAWILETCVCTTHADTHAEPSPWPTSSFLNVTIRFLGKSRKIHASLVLCDGLQTCSFIPSWLVTANKSIGTQHFKYRLPKEVKVVGCALSTLCDQRLQCYSVASGALRESLRDWKQVLDSMSGRQTGWSSRLSSLLSQEHATL